MSSFSHLQDGPLGNSKCVGMFSGSGEETRHFQPNWAHVLNDTSEANSAVEIAFTHQKVEGGFHIRGQHGNYQPRGYVATLGQFSRKIQGALNMLKKTNLVDRLTKALIIDVVTYNGNTNLFTRIRMIIEQPSIGNLVVSGHIRTFVLYMYVGNAGTVTLMLQFVWLIVMTFMTVKMIRAIIKQKKTYFSSNYWNIWRFLGLTFSVSTTISFLVRVILAMKLIEKLKNEFGKYMLQIHPFNPIKCVLETSRPEH